jgi:8-oxo-dGTP diphosphatase
MDEIVYKNEWIVVKKTFHDFYYLERKGKDSIAIFLIRVNEGKYEVLVRYQPMPLDNSDDMKLYPCPITGSIDKNEVAILCAKREVLEETGYNIEYKNIIYLGKYSVGTQTNEKVYMYCYNANTLTPENIRGDDSIHEKLSKNKWEDIENLKYYEYSACQIMYYKIKELFKI